MYTIKVWSKNNLNSDWSYQIDRKDLSLTKALIRCFFLLRWKKTFEVQYIQKDLTVA